MKQKRGSVWLAAAGLVVNERDEWLVVKKKYGGLKGAWSLPAGFVDKGETVDQAAAREVLEETGIIADVKKVIGVRTGVIGSEISDNMIIFALTCKQTDQMLKVQEKEIEEAKWMSVEALLNEEKISQMIPAMIEKFGSDGLTQHSLGNPGDHFNYTAYHLFL
jgi:8-oxo-dGTP diphosphatase